MLPALVTFVQSVHQSLVEIVAGRKAMINLMNYSSSVVHNLG